MQTVIRTPTFLSDAKAAGLSDDEQNDIVLEISKDPTAGALMEGTVDVASCDLPARAKASGRSPGAALR